MNESDLPPCMIYIDKQGRWYHQGVEMIHREIIRLFYRQMEIDPGGRYIISWAGERCYVEVEDTPFVVRRAEYKGSGDDRRKAGITLSLSDDSREALDPETLVLGRENVLYCRVKESTFPARFDRPAYYQLAEYIEEENGGFFLPLNGKKHWIKEDS